MFTRMFAFSIVAVLLLGACKKKEYCTIYGYRVWFAGFDTTQVQQVRVMRYEEGSGFTKLVDSVVATLPYKSAPDYFQQRGDTIINSYDGMIKEPYDYRIIVLPVNRTWEVTKLKYNTDVYNSVSHDKTSPSKCSLMEYTVDGKRNQSIRGVGNPIILIK